VTGLYAILDLSVSARGSADPDEALDRALAEAMAGGCRLFQYRDKTATGREMLARATRLATACRAADATFIVNDRLDVALLCGADGCHLGQDDLPPSAARRLAPAGFLIGVSTHDASEARRAADDGADYVGVGAVYPTETKADARPARGPALVAEIAAAVAIPSVAIGGITHRNVRPVIHAGAAAVAVASALFAAPDIAASAREFIRIWDEEKRNP
jgi:thiamine-phosphate pyrophosphorylase